MPIRKTRRVKREELGESHKRFLLRGFEPLRLSIARFYTRAGVLDLDTTREAWEALRAELLPAYVAEHPGRRPAAWWQFDSPEPMRQQLGGYNYRGDTQADAIPRRSRCGVPTTSGPREWSDPPVYETQAAFLARHNLLTAGERSALGPDYPTQEATCLRVE
jgi:hypothetical protein